MSSANFCCYLVWACWAVKVWHVFRFEQRFELPGDTLIQRKSAVKSVSHFMGVARGPEAASHLEQLARPDDGDGSQFCLLLGVLRLLISDAAKWTLPYREYLLDFMREPLTNAGIGRLLNMLATETRRILRRLVSAGLIERVDWPADTANTPEDLVTGGQLR